MTNKRDLIILLILITIGIFIWKPKKKIEPLPILEKSEMTILAEELKESYKVIKEKQKNRSKFKDFGRSPFILLKLQSIFLQGDNFYVVINKQLLKKGDKIEGYTITNIEKWKVILVNEYKKIELNIFSDVENY